MYNEGGVEKVIFKAPNNPLNKGQSNKKTNYVASRSDFNESDEKTRNLPNYEL